MNRAAYDCKHTLVHDIMKVAMDLKSFGFLKDFNCFEEDLNWEQL